MDKPPSIILEGKKRGRFIIFLPIIKDVFLLMPTSFFLYLTELFFNFYRQTILLVTCTFQNSHGQMIMAFPMWYSLSLAVGFKNPYS